MRRRWRRCGTAGLVGSDPGRGQQLTRKRHCTVCTWRGKLRCARLYVDPLTLVRRRPFHPLTPRNIRSILLATADSLLHPLFDDAPAFWPDHAVNPEHNRGCRSLARVGLPSTTAAGASFAILASPIIPDILDKPQRNKRRRRQVGWLHRGIRRRDVKRGDVLKDECKIGEALHPIRHDPDPRVAAMIAITCFARHIPRGSDIQPSIGKPRQAVHHAEVRPRRQIDLGIGQNVGAIGTNALWV